MDPWLTVILIIAAWAVLILAWSLVVVRRLAAGPAGDPTRGLIWMVCRVYCRLMHRLTVTGRRLVPDSNRPGGLIVIANHTGPIDALLIQSACRFEIRWMMASDMMVPQLDVLWRFLNLISVARDGRDSGPAREAIRQVKAGGVVGIFPEGAIPRPAGELRPFHQGAGLVIARTKAPVLLVWVTGTPASTELFKAMATPSRSQVAFLELIDFSKTRDPAAITEDLRRRLAEASGWPLNDDPLPPTNGSADPFAVG